MKFSAFASLALLAGAASAKHIPNFKAPRAIHKRVGPSASPTPTSSSASTGPTPPAGNSTAAFPSGIKRGLSYNDASLTTQFDAQEVSWAYDWAQTPGGTLPDGVEFIPTLWSDNPSFTATWSENANNAIAAGASWLFSFNECDDAQQANMTPQQAATAYQQFVMPFAGKAKLVAPSFTNGGPPMGTAWLDQFIEACTGCQIDAINPHIYDSATNAAYYKEYLSGIVTKYGKPVFVTEFGATGSPAQVQSFLADMVPWLDAEVGIVAYAYFMDAAGVLVNADGSLAALGETYVSS